jgi:hypothetical protein
VATGELADAIRRDLLTDQLDFDDLGWRGLWAYITTAPPGTAIHHARSKGWVVGDKLAAETLTDLRTLLHRYVSVHFEGGADLPFPEPIDYPGRGATTDEAAKTWETVTIDELISPEVRALMEGA